MPYRLVAIKGPLKGRTFVVVKTETRIGRDPSNDLVLADDYVSRLHATIVQRGDQHLIINASPNGTLVNGKKVDRAALRTGDELALGAATVLRYDRDVAAAAADKQEVPAKAPPTAAEPARSLWKRRPKLLAGGIVYALIIAALAIFLATRKSKETVAEVPYLTAKDIGDDLERPLKPEYDSAASQRALRRAMDLYDRRLVDPANLYATIVAFKEAEAYQGGRPLTDPKHIRAFETARMELGKKVEDLYFEAYALQKTGNYNKARDTYAKIQQAVNDPESAIFKNVTLRLDALQPFIVRPRWSR